MVIKEKKRWNEVLIISRSMGVDVSVPTQGIGTECAYFSVT